VSEELQVKGKISESIDVLFGGFYLKSKPYGPYGTGSTVGQAATGPKRDFTTVNYNFYSETSRALFGNLNVNLESMLDGLKFNAGLRYTWDKQQACTATDRTTQG